MYKNGLIRKLKSISKFMTSHTGQQIITINTFTINNYNKHNNNKHSNISKSKSNQAKKFNKSIEHNMRNIFLEKSHTKCGGEASPRPIYKKSKLRLFLTDLVPNIIRFVLF